MTLSSRLEILRSLARKLVVLEKADQIGGQDATTSARTAGLLVPQAAVRRIVEESVLEAWWNLQSWGSRVLALHANVAGVKRMVWRGEELERGNIWIFLPPS